MKKFITVLTVLIITSCSYIISFASPNDSNLIVIQEEINVFYNVSVSDDFMNQISLAGFNPNDNYFLWLRKSSTYLQAYVYSAAEYNTITHQLNCTSPGTQVNYHLSNGSVYTNSSNSWNVSIDVSTDQIIGYYNNVIESDAIHDYSIPNFSATFVNPINENLNEPQICVGFEYSHGGSGRRRGEVSATIEPSSSPSPNRFLEYNVEVVARFGICNKFNINGTGSFLNWYPVNVDYTDFINVYEISDNKKITDKGNNDYYLDLPNTLQEWTDLYNSNVETIVFNWNANITATGKNYQQNNYKNNNMKYAGVQYNIADVYVRFVKMVNGEKHVGNWTHYVNSSVGTGTPPYNSIDVIPIEPSANTSILDPDSGDQLIENGNQDNTLLPDINVNTVVNMPNQNQLNYPTVVSYNKDVVFQEWAGFAERIPNFFTSITAFATMAFSFIPSEIWAIIGMGLVLSIAVMVLKIL